MSRIWNLPAVMMIMNQIYSLVTKYPYPFGGKERQVTMCSPNLITPQQRLCGRRNCCESITTERPPNTVEAEGWVYKGYATWVRFRG